jgi:hypothetical protein
MHLLLAFSILFFAAASGFAQAPAWPASLRSLNFLVEIWTPGEIGLLVKADHTQRPQSFTGSVARECAFDQKTRRMSSIVFDGGIIGRYSLIQRSSGHVTAD